MLEFVAVVAVTVAVMALLYRWLEPKTYTPYRHSVVRRFSCTVASTRGDGPNRWTTRRRPAHHPCEGVQKSQKVPWHKIRSERIWGWGTVRIRTPAEGN